MRLSACDKTAKVKHDRQRSCQAEKTIDLFRLSRRISTGRALTDETKNRLIPAFAPWRKQETDRSKKINTDR
ncbi:hypothetical protein DI43_15015 [Geobacillus sp. CAMR12739]|nr:hypothetical protein DI43_15015 [Geobacillus sp. CAMR12739]